MNPRPVIEIGRLDLDGKSMRYLVYRTIGMQAIFTIQNFQ